MPATAWLEPPAEARAGWHRPGRAALLGHDLPRGRDQVCAAVGRDRAPQAAVPQLCHDSLGAPYDPDSFLLPAQRCCLRLQQATRCQRLRLSATLLPGPARHLVTSSARAAETVGRGRRGPILQGLHALHHPGHAGQRVHAVHRGPRDQLPERQLWQLIRWSGGPARPADCTQTLGATATEPGPGGWRTACENWGPQPSGRN